MNVKTVYVVALAVTQFTSRKSHNALARQSTMMPEMEDKSNRTNSQSEEKNYEDAQEDKDETLKSQPIIWRNAIAITIFHLIALHSLLYLLDVKVLTIAWVLVMAGICGFGVTGGAHRLWTHRSYKAKLPLRIILILCYSAAGQNPLYDWVRDHRVHHKYSETDADPHNSKRGFFFSHVGWLMQKKHPEVLRKGKLIDMNDITRDPVVQFHLKYFLPLKILLCFIIPIIIPVYFWNETWKYAILSQAFFRYAFVLNATWSVNSFAHIWGTRPYDRTIKPVENIGVAVVAFGEGWHNYHHAFPWDYKAAELGQYSLNLTTMLLDLFAKIGWAYDLKMASPGLIMKYVEKQGDGSHPKLKNLKSY